MQVEISRKKKTTVSDIPFGECCTFPRYGNNIVCMRIKTQQEYVSLRVNSDYSRNTYKMLDLATGIIHLVGLFEPCIPIKVKVVAI